MQNRRFSARAMSYEECSMGTTPMIATGALLERDSIPEGYHCYDIRVDESIRETGIMVALSGESGQADGSIILAEPLDFDGKKELRLEGVTLHEEDPIVCLEDFMMKTKGQVQTDEQEASWGPALSM